MHFEWFDKESLHRVHQASRNSCFFCFFRNLHLSCCCSSRAHSSEIIKFLFLCSSTEVDEAQRLTILKSCLNTTEVVFVDLKKGISSTLKCVRLSSYLRHVVPFADRHLGQLCLSPSHHGPQGGTSPPVSPCCCLCRLKSWSFDTLHRQNLTIKGGLLQMISLGFNNDYNNQFYHSTETWQKEKLTGKFRH